MGDTRTYLFPLILFLFQVIFIILFGFHSKYKYYPASNVTNLEDPPRGLVEFHYAMFTDVHVMLFVGFGFLMTFLRRYSFSAVGFNFILCVFTLEWALLIRGYIFDRDVLDGKFIVDLQSLTTADFVAASILISMGAVLGKVNAIQLILMSLIEVPIQIANEYVGLHLFCARDPGESMYVHTFGAYFGLAVAFVLYRSKVQNASHEKSRYTSDIFSMIGTIFLFCFWPSFNAAGAVGIERLFAIINTFASICASVIGAFLMSSFLKKGKLDMVHIQNSTLAGGVAVGTIAASNIGVHGAMVVGTLAGMISVLGFEYLLPRLKRMRIHDTCGVNNLHGIPGLMAGIAGIIIAFIGDRSGYLKHLTNSCLSGGETRNYSTQAAYQAAALGLTIGVAIVGGVLTGAILRIPIFAQEEEDFDDEYNWHLPEELHHQHQLNKNPNYRITNISTPTQV